MRYFVVYLSDSPDFRYRPLVSEELSNSQVLHWDQASFLTLAIAERLSLSDIKNIIRAQSRPGDYVLWYPDLRIRTASYLNGSRHFLSAFRSRRHQVAIESLLSHPLASTNPYPNFSDETLRFHTLPMEGVTDLPDHQLEIADPWAGVLGARVSAQGEVESVVTSEMVADRWAHLNRTALGDTTVHPIGRARPYATGSAYMMARQSDGSRVTAGEIVSGPFHTIDLGQPSQTQPAITDGYRLCASGEMIYWGYRLYAGDVRQWREVRQEYIGSTIRGRLRVIAPDAPWPDWIRRYKNNHAYRYLEIGEFVQDGDFAILGDGTLRVVGGLSIGTVVNSHAKDCFLRYVGRDGWRELSQSENPQDGAWELTEVRSRPNADWSRVSISHTVNRSLQYRRLVTGYKQVWTSCNLEAPLGYRWAEVGYALVRADGHLMHDNGTMTRLGEANNFSWFRVPVERRFLVRDPAWDWNSLCITPGSFNITVSLIKFQCTSDVFQNGIYWVLNRHGMMPVHGYGRSGLINTAIGNFYPTSFQVNGQVRVVFCTDQVRQEALADLLRDSLLNTVSGLQQLLPITMSQYQPQIIETEGRQVEL